MFFNLFKKSKEDVFIQNIITNQIQRLGYFSRSQNKRVLNDLEEHTQRNGDYFFKLNNKILLISEKNKKKLHKKMNGAFWVIDIHSEMAI